MVNEARREWRNSRFGRALGTVFALGMVYAALFVKAENGTSQTYRVLVGFGILVFAMAVAVAVWTSRLVFEGGILTATHFGRSTSVPISDVQSIEPAWWPLTGLIIKTTDYRRVRTLVTGSVGDELWKSRADRICEEIEELAGEAR